MSVYINYSADASVSSNRNHSAMKVWQDNQRRYQETIALEDIIRTFGTDYKVLFVGDATMGPYEIVAPGGSVEHWNEKSGSDYMKQLLSHFNKVAWLNPQPESHWSYHHSIAIINQLVDNKMYPLTVDGIGRVIKEIS